MLIMANIKSGLFQTGRLPPRWPSYITRPSICSYKWSLHGHRERLHLLFSGNTRFVLRCLSSSPCESVRRKRSWPHACTPHMSHARFRYPQSLWVYVLIAIGCVIQPMVVKLSLEILLRPSRSELVNRPINTSWSSFEYPNSDQNIQIPVPQWRFRRITSDMRPSTTSVRLSVCFEIRTNPCRLV
jgi:hypothetical protein